MKHISRSYLKECFEYSPENGTLRWKVRPDFHFPSSPNAQTWNARFAGREVGSITATGYRRLSLDKRWYLAHRLIWRMVVGEWPDQIDHINGDRLDNRIENLRSVSRMENMRNRMLPRNNETGVHGVHWKPRDGVWHAQIGIDGRIQYLGSFATKAEAVEARRVAERKLGFHQNHGRAGPLIDDGRAA